MNSGISAGLEAVFLPGGSATAIICACGAIAALRAPAPRKVGGLAAKGWAGAGDLQNGFQVLTDACPLPGALTRATGACPFLLSPRRFNVQRRTPAAGCRAMPAGRTIQFTDRHGEGRYQLEGRKPGQSWKRRDRWCCAYRAIPIGSIGNGRRLLQPGGATFWFDAPIRSEPVIPAGRDRRAAAASRACSDRPTRGGGRSTDGGEETPCCRRDRASWSVRPGSSLAGNPHRSEPHVLEGRSTRRVSSTVATNRKIVDGGVLDDAIGNR